MSYDSHYISTENIGSNQIININHPEFNARISRFGAQLLEYAPNNAKQVIWLSNSADLSGAKAIRGGTPICWPWFGPSTEQFKGEPQHGYARIVEWQLDVVEEHDKGINLTFFPLFEKDVEQKLGLSLRLEYCFSDSLEIHLTTTNTSNCVKPVSQAIHTYFYVDSIFDTKLNGLNKLTYQDKLTNTQAVQNGDVKITQETDRVYLNATESIYIEDNYRTIVVTGDNHDSVVVWNPWQDKAESMSDFDDDGYKTMLCVEMANTQDLKLAPTQQHTLSQMIRLT